MYLVTSERPISLVFLLSVNKFSLWLINEYLTYRLLNDKLYSLIVITIMSLQEKKTKLHRRGI